MKLVGFGLANFRSFGGEGSFVRDFGKINIFIGKNNSGKSNVLRFLQSVAAVASNVRDRKISELDRHKKATEQVQLGLSMAVETGMREQFALQDPTTPAPETLDFWLTFPEGHIKGDSPLNLFTNRWLERFHNKLTNNSLISGPSRQELLKATTGALARQLQTEFRNMVTKLIYVPAIREIREMQEDAPTSAIDLSGRNLIRLLRRMQHPLAGREADQKRFRQIQELIRSLLGVDNLVLEIPTEEDDLYLTIYGNRLPLAHYGTGVHELVIICSTLALHDNHVVCIEEPEIHLHPELLRKFQRFLTTTNNTYFIATHSNVLLDANDGTVVYHVSHDGTSSHITRSQTNEHTRAVLRDLCYRASDLLQSNGIIWVEGPSDRIYLNRWLSLYGSEFVEGFDYSVMFYGGACLANLSAMDGGFSKDFVELLRINSNAIVVIDRDGSSPSEALRAYKQRIQNEIGDDKCWITRGREIENYLPPELLERYLKTQFPDRAKKVRFKQNDKIEDCIRRAVRGRSFDYAKSKKDYAKKFCEHMTADDLGVLDLRRWLKRIHDTIGRWNAG